MRNGFYSMPNGQFKNMLVSCFLLPPFRGSALAFLRTLLVKRSSK